MAEEDRWDLDERSRRELMLPGEDDLLDSEEWDIEQQVVMANKVHYRARGCTPGRRLSLTWAARTVTSNSIKNSWDSKMREYWVGSDMATN